MSDDTLDEVRHGGITLAQLAELTALSRISSGPPFGEALSAHGLSEDGWKAAQDAWNRAIEGDVERGDGGLVMAYADALAAAKERVRRGQTPTVSVAVAAAVPEPEPAPRATPTFLAAQAHVERPAPLERVSEPPPLAPAPPPRMAGRAELDPDEEAGLGETAALPLQAILAGILPFREGAAGAPPAPAPLYASVPIQTAAPAVNKAPASLETTAPVPVVRTPTRTMPFANNLAAESATTSPPAPSPPRLTVEHFAALTAEIAARPDRELDIRAKYHVAQEATWQALQREWRQRVDADPALARRLHELVTHYRAWHQRAGG